ncbi:MAG: hypothetical protein EOO40_04580, partial [Deltaproteobacteria bacterium]
MQRQLTGEERGHLAIKSVFGAAVAVTAYNLTHNKDEQGNPTLEISGAGTGTPSKDAQLRADGWQPYSIKAGGKWYSYANTPVGLMLSVIGNLSDGEKYRGEHVEKSNDALSAVALNSFRALQFAKDMTALKGAADFLAAADSKTTDGLTRWAQRLAVGTVKGYVPWSALLTQVAKDGEQWAGEPRKQARSFGQSLVQDIPVARNGLHDALDVLGDPLPIDTDRLISSAPYRDAPTRAVWDWLEKNELFITVPNRNSGGAMVLRAHQGEETPMTDDEYFAFMHKRGQLLKEALHHQLPELQKLPPDQAKKHLQQVVKRVTRTAKQQVFGGASATAKTVQETLFPETDAQMGPLSISGFYEPASECGGDWWHYCLVGKKIFLWIGDATGHGAPAALITSAAKSASSIIERLNINPAQALELLNKSIFDVSKGRIMMTFFLASYDPDTQEMTYANASHEAPFLIKHSEGTLKKKDLVPLNEVNNPRLGQSRDTKYKQTTVKLDPNDMVLFYTDGIPEVQNALKVSWGERDFLKAIVAANKDYPTAHDSVMRLTQMMQDHRQGEVLIDDVTF